MRKKINLKRKQMKKLSGQLKFEQAAILRDEIKELSALMVLYG